MGATHCTAHTYTALHCLDLPPMHPQPCVLNNRSGWSSGSILEDILPPFSEGEDFYVRISNSNSPYRIRVKIKLNQWKVDVFVDLEPVSKIVINVAGVKHMAFYITFSYKPEMRRLTILTALLVKTYETIQISQSEDTF